VIIGNKKDDSIGGALRWALTLTDVEHRIHYPSTTGDPKMMAPSVPNASNDDWVPYTPARKPPRAATAVAPPCMLCCYYEEVIVIAHGSQQGLWRLLLGDAATTGCLPDIFQGKKPKRCVFWVCGTAAKVYPHEVFFGGIRYFEWLAFLVGPPVSCPCGCDPAHCNAWNAKQTRKNLKCPHAGECVTLLSAAWYDKPAHLGGVNHHAARLGIDDKDNKSPFLSPDGRVLQTDLCAIWLPGAIPTPVIITQSETTTLPAAGAVGRTIFDGAKVKADSNLMSPNDPVVSPDRHTGPKGRSLGLKPLNYRRVRYVGPSACAARDGCIPD